MVRVKTSKRSIRQYKNFVSTQLYNDILELSKSLKGLRVAEINATANAGGVAELLSSIVPILNSLSLDVSWYVLPPNEEFFEVTKFIHNCLQGKRGELSKRQKSVYLSHTEEFSKSIAKIKADIFVIHDPQPLAAIHFLDGAIKPAVWRCHIDLSNPNKNVWEFLKPYAIAFDKLVFSMPEYVPYDIPPDKVSIFTPTIDPLNPKNVPMAKEKAKRIVSMFGIDLRKPLVTQVSRFDPWKDPMGVIYAYKIAKRKIPKLQLALVGEFASDDPEGVRIYEEIKKETLNDPNLFVLCLPHSNETINAFQTVSDVIIQKSIREGFGLTVTEAMWKAKAVIGGRVGGIKYQIEDDKSGILVSDVSECSRAIVELIQDHKLRSKLGKKAKERVRENFLMPRKVLDWLLVFKELARDSSYLRVRQRFLLR